MIHVFLSAGTATGPSWEVYTDFAERFERAAGTEGASRR